MIARRIANAALLGTIACSSGSEDPPANEYAEMWRRFFT